MKTFVLNTSVSKSGGTETYIKMNSNIVIIYNYYKIVLSYIKGNIKYCK